MILDAIEKIPGGKNTNYANGDEMILAKAPTERPKVLPVFALRVHPWGLAVLHQGGGDGRKNPYRLSIRSPMFITIRVAKTMIGYKVADIPAIMGSSIRALGRPTAEVISWMTGTIW